MITDDFSNINNQSIDRTGFVDLGGANKYTLMSFDDTLTLENLARKNLKNIESVAHKIINLDKTNQIGVTEYVLTDYLSAADKMELTRLMNAGEKRRDDRVYNFYNLSYVSMDASDEFVPDYLEFKFSCLDSVKVFQEVCLQNNLEPDMQIIKSRHLFAEVGSVSKVLAGGFILFSLLMLFIFTNSFISRHIEDIKPNLGTLLAYGMPGKLIINNYLSVILLVYFVAFLLGLVFALLLSWALYGVLGVPFIFKVEIILLLLLAVVITMVYSRKLIINIFSKTPGDLIYKR